MHFVLQYTQIEYNITLFKRQLQTGVLKNIN